MIHDKLKFAISAEKIDKGLDNKANRIIAIMGVHKSYDEAIETAMEHRRLLGDTAFDSRLINPHYRTMRDNFDLAWALNRKHNLNRKDHLEEVKVRVKYNNGSVDQETTTFIMISYLNQERWVRILESKVSIFRELIFKGVPHSQLKDLEVTLV